jgi:hypothetical protein
MTTQFKITGPGEYRTEINGKAVVYEVCGGMAYGRFGNAERRWLGKYRLCLTTGSTSDDNLVAVWTEKPKVERITVYREACDEILCFRCRTEPSYTHAHATSHKGFAGYLYDIDGQEVISALPCGWVAYEGGDRDNPRIADAPWLVGAEIVFPVAFLRKVEG